MSEHCRHPEDTPVGGVARLLHYSRSRGCEVVSHCGCITIHFSKNFLSATITSLFLRQYIMGLNIGVTMV